MNDVQLKISLLGEFRDILVSVKCGLDIEPDIECLGAFKQYVSDSKDLDIRQAFYSIVEMDLFDEDEIAEELFTAINLLIV